MTVARHDRVRRRAFTLVEAAISTVIVGVMIVAALEVVGSSAEARRRSIELRRADDLLAMVHAEIAAAYFEEPSPAGYWGPEANESESPRTFDDIDDYDGLSASPPVDRAGAAIDAFAEWKYSVIVTPVTSGLDGFDTGDESAPMRLVEITVRSTKGVQKEGAYLFSRDGTPAFDPTRTTVQDAAINLPAQTNTGRSVTISSPLLNTPEAP